MRIDPLIQRLQRREDRKRPAGGSAPVVFFAITVAKAELDGLRSATHLLVVVPDDERALRFDFRAAANLKRCAGNHQLTSCEVADRSERQLGRRAVYTPRQTG